MVDTPDGKHLWQACFDTRCLPSETCLPCRQVRLREVCLGQKTAKDACHKHPSRRVCGSHLSISDVHACHLVGERVRHVRHVRHVPDRNEVRQVIHLSQVPTTQEADCSETSAPPHGPTTHPTRPTHDTNPARGRMVIWHDHEDGSCRLCAQHLGRLADPFLTGCIPSPTPS